MLVEEVLVRLVGCFLVGFQKKNKIICTKSHVIFFAFWLLQFYSYPLANI